MHVVNLDFHSLDSHLVLFPLLKQQRLPKKFMVASLFGAYDLRNPVSRHSEFAYRADDIIESGNFLQGSFGRVYAQIVRLLDSGHPRWMSVNDGDSEG